MMIEGAALDENAIVEAVCGHLIEQGWQITQRLTTKQSGIDIIAMRNGDRLFVEAKGGTSSFEGSARFGKGYTATQAFDRVAKGLLTGLELLDRYPDDQIALAFPADPYFLRYVGRVKVALARTGLTIFWVKRNGIVTEGVTPPSA